MIIIQNTNSGIVRSYEDVIVASFFARSARLFGEVYTYLGATAFWEMYDKIMVKRANDISTPEKAKYKKSIINRLENLGIDLSKTEHGWYGSDYKLYFRP